VGFCDIAIPNSQIHRILHAALLVPSVQHPVVFVFDVFPELVYLRQIATYPIVIEVPL
jgi:hypothetical protein